MPSQSAQYACALTADPPVRDARWPPPSASLTLVLLFSQSARRVCVWTADRLVRDARWPRLISIARAGAALQPIRTARVCLDG